MKNIIPSKRLVKQFLVECDCGCSIIRFTLVDRGQNVFIEHLSSSQPTYDKKLNDQSVVMTTSQAKNLIVTLNDLKYIHTDFIVCCDNGFGFKVSVILDAVSMVYYSTNKKFNKNKHDFDFIVDFENLDTFIDNLKELICDDVCTSPRHD